MDKNIDMGTNGGRAAELGDMAEEQLGAVKERLSALGQRLSDFVRERPGTALVAALGAGLIIGRLVRR